MFKKLSLLTGTALCAAFFVQQARAVDNIEPGVIDRGIPEKNITSPVKAKAPARVEQDAPKVERVSEPGEKVPTITGIEFNGNTSVSSDVLHEIAAPFLNKPLTKGDLAELKYQLTTAFYDRGYILVKVTTPPQSLSDGVLTVNVHEAKIGNVIIHNEGVLYPPIAQSLVGRAEHGSVFHEKTAETIVSDLDDLKNVTASINLQPSEQFQSTDLHVHLKDVYENRHFVAFDNYGSELTGDLVGSAYVEHSNLFKMGETFSLMARKSDGDLESVVLGFDSPIGVSNVKLEMDVTYIDSEIGDRLSALDAKGQTNAVNVGLSKNLINTTHEVLSTKLGLDARRHASTIAGTLASEDDIRQLYLSLSYLKRFSDVVVYTEGKLSRGLEIWGASEEGDLLNTITHGDPEALRFEPTVLASWRPIAQGELRFFATGQITNETLLSSDLFVLGGYGSVRGFEPAQETGDSGYSFSVEYLHDIPAHESVQLRAGPWLDGGTVYNRQFGNTIDKNLYSAGIGISAVTDILKVGDTELRLDWAHTLGDYDSVLVDDNTFYFRVKQAF